MIIRYMMTSTIVLIFVISPIVASFLQSTNSEEVSAESNKNKEYSAENFTDLREVFDQNKCISLLDVELDGRKVSENEVSCANFYQDIGCKGNFTVIEPDNAAHRFLNNCTVTYAYKGCVAFRIPVTRQVASIGVYGDVCIELNEIRNCTGGSIKLRKENRWLWNTYMKETAGLGKDNNVKKSKPVTLYSYPKIECSKTKGSIKNFDASECVSPLPIEFETEISSIDTHNNCFNLYDDFACKGMYIAVNIRAAVNTTIENNENGVYAMTVRSIGPCFEECLHKIIEKGNAQPTKVSLFDEAGNKGNQVTLDVTDCVTIPLRMNKRASSILVHGNVCIELHKNWNCKGSSIQFRRGDFPVPFYDHDLGWGFNNEASSVSLCNYNCGIKKIHHFTNTNKNFVPTESKHVTFFSEINYQGDNLRLNVHNNCVNLKKEWPEWVGAVQSIQTPGICIQIYAEPGCSILGKHFVLSQSENNMKLAGFNSILQSVSSCDFVSSRFTSISGNMNFVWLALFMLTLFIAFVVFLRLRRNHKEAINVLTAKEVEEFIRGNENGAKTAEDATYSPAFSQPYNQSYEISEKSLMIDMMSPLGSGAFSIVYRGSIKVSELTEDRPVAVKTVKPYAGAEYARAMLKEIITMIYVGYHPRIVELVACYTKNIWKGELCIITEFFSNGSLEKFFRNHREEFVDSWNNPDVSPTIAFSNLHLVRWCIQIAEGMQYLGSKQVIHGDLATRNVLLDENFHTKISDFGLSRQLYESTEYVKKNHSPLPWRWLAIESLKNLVFSTKSDIWAFGVTVWEIFSLGDTPYPGMVCDQRFISGLKNGKRLPKPEFGTAECYELMLSCWREKPSERVSFLELKTKFRNILLERITQSNIIQSPNTIDFESLREEFPEYIELCEL